MKTVIISTLLITFFLFSGCQTMKPIHTVEEVDIRTIGEVGMALAATVATRPHLRSFICANSAFISRMRRDMP